MRGWRARSPTSSSAGSTRPRSGRAVWCSMRSRTPCSSHGRSSAARTHGSSGGSVRDELLGRPALDSTSSVTSPSAPLERLHSGAAAPSSPSRTSTAAGVWRSSGGRTTDFTPLQGGSIDPTWRPGTSRSTPSRCRSRAVIRSTPSTAGATSSGVCCGRSRPGSSTPIRSACCGRFAIEDELGFRLEPETERLVRGQGGARRAGRPASGSSTSCSGCPPRVRAARGAGPARAARRR